MTTIENGKDYLPVPFLTSTEIPTEKEGLSLEQYPVDDPEILDFIDQNRFEVTQGAIDIDKLSKFSSDEALAYKMLLNDNEHSPDALAGVVYLVKKGMDQGTVQILYVVGADYQGEGIASASVSAITETVGKEYDIVANIENSNLVSEKIVRKLGYWSLDDKNGITPFVKPRSR